MKKPHKYIITGVDEAGAPAPVIANVTCTNESGSFSTYLAIEGFMVMRVTSAKKGLQSKSTGCLKFQKQCSSIGQSIFSTKEANNYVGIHRNRICKRST